MVGEFETIRRLAARFGASTAEGVTLGIGDDAAVLRAPGSGELVWTVDAQVDGRHFRRAWMTFEDVGWRSFVAAASDLSAMGATPWCALSSLVVPADLTDDAIDALTRGQADAARAVGCPVVGGNLARGGELSVTTTLLGRTDRAVRRDGANAGDGAWLAGDVGLARAGFLALSTGTRGDGLDDAIDAFRRPRVLAPSAPVLGAHASAAIDVSDGLAQDGDHLASASGVALVLEEASLLAHAGEIVRRAALSLNESRLALVLTGGEDYALLATSREPLEGFTRVGVVEPGEGVWLRGADGSRRRVNERGFDHFR